MLPHKRKQIQNILFYISTNTKVLGEKQVLEDVKDSLEKLIETNT